MSKLRGSIVPPGFKCRTMTQRSENIWSQCVHLNGIIGMGCLFSVTLSTSTFDDKHKSDLVKTKSDKLTPQE